MDWKSILAVSAGGAVGAVLRHLVSVSMTSALGTRFPWGTLVVNAVGGLLIGVLMELATRGMPAHVRLLLVTGVLGGLTTFSAFSFETVALLSAKSWGLALLNTVGNLTLGLGGAALGRWLTQLWL